MKRAAIVLMVLLLSVSGAYAWMTGEAGHNTYLYPVVRVLAPGGVGSGTVVYSKDVDGDGKFNTYVLTNHHVIASAIEVVTEWNSRLKKEEKVERREIVYVEVFGYKDLSTPVECTKIEADIMIYSDYDSAEDMAILKLRSEKEAAHIAKIIPRDRVNDYHVFDETVAVGCSRGFNPMPSFGGLSRKSFKIRTYDYDMSSSQIVAGNSGGAMFLAGTGELIGIPSRGVVTGWLSTPIAHMGIFIPAERILGWLEREKYDFVFNSALNEIDRIAEREKEIEDKKKEG